MDTSEPGFGEALSAAASRTERMLETCLPPAQGDRGEAELAAAMRHAVLDGGKRLRAFLALEVAALFGAVGQYLYKSGAEAAEGTFMSFVVNPRILGGVVCYIAVMVLFAPAVVSRIGV